MFSTLSPLGIANRYAFEEWPSLGEYLEYGETEIGDNGIENTLRPVAVGRNHLFVGSPNGGESAAVLFSLITPCKRLQVTPWAYLKVVIDRFSTHPAARVEELTARGWNAALDEREAELSARTAPQA
jgi:hypothetical protein